MSNINAPQPGFQMDFLANSADICVGGGAVGVGKSHTLCRVVLPYLKLPVYEFGFFRREYAELKGPGSIWEESKTLFPHLGGVFREGSPLDWRFPNGALGIFGAMQHDADVEKYKGRSFATVCFDEMTTFSEYQFWMIWMRMRSTSGVRPFVRGATNPDPDSFVRKFIDWWINSDGYPDLSRAGKIRYFCRVGDTMHWGDDPHELEHTHRKKPNSVSFVPGRLTENKILLAQDPTYYDKLDNLPAVDRDRLLGGNWDVRRQAGDYFQRAWFTSFSHTWKPHLPLDKARTGLVRAWDLASTPIAGDQVPGGSDPVGETPRKNDPDWSVGVLVSRIGQWYPELDYLVEDVLRYRDRSGAIEQCILDTAERDGRKCTVALYQDPGQAGVAQTERIRDRLTSRGHNVIITRETQNKETKAKPASAAAESRRIGYMGAPWNDTFFNELEGFPDGKKKDQVDALSGAFTALAQISPVIENIDDMHYIDTSFLQKNLRGRRGAL